MLRQRLTRLWTWSICNRRWGSAWLARGGPPCLPGVWPGELGGRLCVAVPVGPTVDGRRPRGAGRLYGGAHEKRARGVEPPTSSCRCPASTVRPRSISDCSSLRRFFGRLLLDSRVVDWECYTSHAGSRVATLSHMETPCCVSEETRVEPYLFITTGEFLSGVAWRVPHNRRLRLSPISSAQGAR